MDVLGFVVLVVTGFTACAEFGSYAFVHPVVRRLPPAELIVFEQGLLRTFGRAYPVLMPVTGVLLVVYAGCAVARVGRRRGVGCRSRPGPWRR